MVESKIKENIQPVAKVELAQAVAEGSASAGKSGEEVYKAVCSMCHQAGMLNAPKLGDTQAWASRISQGYETLVQHAIKGIRSMPAKGGNASLSDAEVAGAVLYMTNSSGASFKK
jgi:cytochrome c5